MTCHGANYHQPTAVSAIKQVIYDFHPHQFHKNTGLIELALFHDACYCMTSFGKVGNISCLTIITAFSQILNIDAINSPNHDGTDHDGTDFIYSGHSHAHVASCFLFVLFANAGG